MKSVSPKKYDFNYFKNLYGIYNYSKKFTITDFKEIQRYTAGLVKLSKSDYAIDFGCGNGDLAILLAYKYGCRTLGIDYSPDAIKIAKIGKSLLKKNKPELAARVNYLSVKNENLPNLKNVSAVYMCDVIEHLYDEEVKVIIEKFISWKKDRLLLVIHTDNNDYLRFIRPVTDFISLVLRKTTIAEIKKRNNWEKERHVNLTTPNELIEKLTTYGFKKKKLIYSPVNKKRIKNQLAALGSISLLVSLISFLAGILPFLLPSFYLVVEKES